MVTLEGIVFWNNQPDREASSLVRKGVGRNTILRAVETPYPTVNPIQSNPVSLFNVNSYNKLHTTLCSDQLLVLSKMVYLEKFDLLKLFCQLQDVRLIFCVLFHEYDKNIPEQKWHWNRIFWSSCFTCWRKWTWWSLHRWWSRRPSLPPKSFLLTQGWDSQVSCSPAHIDIIAIIPRLSNVGD